MNTDAIHDLIHSEADEYIYLVVKDGKLSFGVNTEQLPEMLLTFMDGCPEYKPDLIEFSHMVLADTGS